jgi:hypothetical protein
MYPMLKDESGGGGGERGSRCFSVRCFSKLGKFKIRPGKWPRKGPERDIGTVQNIRLEYSEKAQEESLRLVRFTSKDTMLCFSEAKENDDN